jgi:hypothetical protein
VLARVVSRDPCRGWVLSSSRRFGGEELENKLVKYLRSTADWVSTRPGVLMVWPGRDTDPPDGTQVAPSDMKDRKTQQSRYPSRLIKLPLKTGP